MIVKVSEGGGGDYLSKLTRIWHPRPIFVMTRDGAKASEKIQGDEMTAPWVLTSFAGSEG